MLRDLVKSSLDSVKNLWKKIKIIVAKTEHLPWIPGFIKPEVSSAVVLDMVFEFQLSMY